MGLLLALVFERLLLDLGLKKLGSRRRCWERDAYSL
jgi:hypothetical protein